MSDSLVAYIGYPADLYSSPPHWAGGLLGAQQDGSTLRSFVSGGSLSDSLYEELSTRDVSSRLERLEAALHGSYTSRLLGPMGQGLADLRDILGSSHTSAELSILANLWVMVRSDVFLVDCDLSGRGSCGMETLYADIIGLVTVGVADSPSLDPWYFYHLSRIVKPYHVGTALAEISLALADPSVSDTSLTPD